MPSVTEILNKSPLAQFLSPWSCCGGRDEFPGPGSAPCCCLGATARFFDHFFLALEHGGLQWGQPQAVSLRMSCVGSTIPEGLPLVPFVFLL